MIRLRSPSRSPPDASNDAFSSSLTTTVINQRSMRRFETTLRRAIPKGQTFISHAAPQKEPLLQKFLLMFRTHEQSKGTVAAPGLTLRNVIERSIAMYRLS